MLAARGLQLKSEPAFGREGDSYLCLESLTTSYGRVNTVGQRRGTWTYLCIGVFYAPDCILSIATSSKCNVLQGSTIKERPNRNIERISRWKCVVTRFVYIFSVCRLCHTPTVVRHLFSCALGSDFYKQHHRVRATSETETGTPIDFKGCGRSFRNTYNRKATTIALSAP